MGPDGPLRVVDNIGGNWDGAQLTIHLKKLNFLLSNVPSGCEPLAYATWFLSCLLFSTGFCTAIRPWRPLQARIRRTVLDETGSLTSTPPGAVRRTGKLSSRAVVLCGLPNLGLLWTSLSLQILSTCRLDTLCYDRARSQTQDQGRFQRRGIYCKQRVESQRINYTAEHAAQELSIKKEGRYRRVNQNRRAQQKSWYLQTVLYKFVDNLAYGASATE